MSVLEFITIGSDDKAFLTGSVKGGGRQRWTTHMHDIIPCHPDIGGKLIYNKTNVTFFKFY